MPVLGHVLGLVLLPALVPAVVAVLEPALALAVTPVLALVVALVVVVPATVAHYLLGRLAAGQAVPLAQVGVYPTQLGLPEWLQLRLAGWRSWLACRRCLGVALSPPE